MHGVPFQNPVAAGKQCLFSAKFARIFPFLKPVDLGHCVKGCLCTALGEARKKSFTMKRQATGSLKLQLRVIGPCRSLDCRQTSRARLHVFKTCPAAVRREQTARQQELGWKSCC
ncbi:hypothetical protein RRG08_066540 [Elysia crispata]|uniref:Uncharacterized protein n=1 Tax=Elysia crispata TaxID=231223 RepID=A0AAE1DII8_9GAST|nr:hypothetical protein RRG08_066540 [Elysia crispata]